MLALECFILAGMKYGYARFSTDDQGPALQLAALKKAGYRQTFTDHGISGATTKRPALARCLKALQPGKTLNPERINCCRGQMQRLVRQFVSSALASLKSN
jgi:DNA invertase Pin-like site-specific DNA recombinase